ncbi:16S rRNA (guanine(527)-N(7))-methyltransferase RsmG [Alkalimonas mucilaginosa]|uniref:Ribosomal RNA small subunit methyltransferase G n=1 Tax=Alkalimonas mucilaginosa TaxID=3057676 RepID=A0ABU7JFH3_9GAMM|nr:16S rRNA (guanine(527)-N(7))-methyltransferase RsmG [Alkalimonas sp. MEB004]MEE2024429.1 16S rRNA (guanine(527)-N(7))-methyltransferase RsmG [Alkalimonas sp. MEB004]
MLRAELDRLLAQTSLSVSELQREQLIGFLQLLHKWNKAYNLTSVREPMQMVGRHLLDSLVVGPFLQQPDCQRIIDVGTGPGLPGVPLAILFPEKHFVLLDSLGKRIRFLNEVKRQLGLSNIEPLQSRVEDHQPQPGYDAVLSRAFASLNDMLHWCRHLPAENGRFLAMKGAAVEEEIAALADFVRVTAVHTLKLPEQDAERYLVELKKITA